MDELYITFTHINENIGDFKEVYTRTNDNKVGIVLEDGTEVTKKATWFFPEKITELDKGEKVLIIGNKGSYYKVKKSEFGKGNWNEEYIKDDKLRLQ